MTASYAKRLSSLSEALIDIEPAEYTPMPHNFIRRDYQQAYNDAMKTHKRGLKIWHRRAGKDKDDWNAMLEAADKDIGQYYYIFPTYSQGKKAIWEGRDKSGIAFLDHIPPDRILVKNNSELKIVFKNGSLIRIVGSDNIDALMGTSPRGVVFSEFSLQNPQAWDFIRPILLENNGWARFNGTPRGKNHMYDLYIQSKDNPNWVVSVKTVDDTGFISKEDIEQERQDGMSEDLIQQEFYCFPAGQFVMTSQGMKDIKDIRPGDMVFTHSGRYRKVLETIERDYEGDLIRLKSFGSSEDILCTPNHPIRLLNQSNQTYRWESAEKVNINDVLCFPKLLFSDRTFIKRELAMIIAWYITEGSASYNAIQFTVRDFDEANEIKIHLDDFFVDCSIHKSETSVNVVVKDTFLLDFLKIHCGNCAKDKKIPLHLICGHERSFLDELMKGDGCIFDAHGRERWSYTTISKTLAYQVQTLAHSLGYTGGISKKEAGTYEIEGRIGKTQESYSVQICPCPTREVVNGLKRSKYSIVGKVKEVDKQIFAGKVYNLKVQFDESYTVNGRAVHNCSFTRGQEGSWYGKYLATLDSDGRITSVPYDSYARVDTFWDLGVGDSTAIIFAQRVGNEIHIIDHYEMHGEGLDHYAKIISERNYNYGNHYAPHDIRVRELAAGARSRLEIARDLGLNFDIVPDLSIYEGIELSRSLFTKLWFDEKKCKYLLKCLLNYVKKYNEHYAVYSDQPLHNWASHSADAFRMLGCIYSQRQGGIKSLQEIEREEKLYRRFT